MYYLAYGSNLHPHRLSRRVPSADPVGVVALPGLRLVFQKRSKDGSAKCMYVDTGSADDSLYAALYTIDDDEKSILDAIEGLGKGYDEAWHRVRIGESTFDAFAYAAAPTHIEPGLKPYDWYRDMVLLGAEYHDLPTAFIDAIRSVSTIPDPDLARAEEKSGICAQMKQINTARDHGLTMMTVPLP